MFRKLLCTFLSVCIIFSSSVYSYASEIESFESISPSVCTGILTSSNGEEYIIYGTKVDNEQRSISNNSSITYRYDLPASIMATGTSSVNSPDSGYVSTVYLTVNYTHRNNQSEYLLTSISGSWVISDYQASVQSAYLNAGCNCDLPLVSNQRIEDRAVSNNFYINTNFSTYIAQDYGIMGAYLTLNYIIGSSRTWSFTLDNTIFDNSFLSPGDFLNA